MCYTSPREPLAAPTSPGGGSMKPIRRQLIASSAIGYPSLPDVRHIGRIGRQPIACSAVGPIFARSAPHRPDIGSHAWSTALACRDSDQLQRKRPPPQQQQQQSLRGSFSSSGGPIRSANPRGRRKGGGMTAGRREREGPQAGHGRWPPRRRRTDGLTWPQEAGNSKRIALCGGISFLRGGAPRWRPAALAGGRAPWMRPGSSWKRLRAADPFLKIPKWV